MYYKCNVINIGYFFKLYFCAIVKCIQQSEDCILLVEISPLKNVKKRVLLFSFCVMNRKTETAGWVSCVQVRQT